MRGYRQGPGLGLGLGPVLAIAMGVVALLFCVPVALFVSWLTLPGSAWWMAPISWAVLLGSLLLAKRFLGQGRWILACLVWSVPVSLAVKACYDFLKSPL